VIVRPPPYPDLEDVRAFVALLGALRDTPWPEVRELFPSGSEAIVARAPGRLDVMGGIADYSGSLVLELPLREATFVAVVPRADERLRIVSLGDGPGAAPSVADIPLADLDRGGKPLSYEEARAYFRRDPAAHWAAYVAGVVVVLMHEKGLSPRGASLLVSSRVPAGKGVGSSAALEVASLQAVAVAHALALDPREAALLAQKTENFVVGARCGAMDPMTSVFGEPGCLMALCCQPAELVGSAALPAGLAVWGLDSGVRHPVSGADDGSVRVGAFMGYRIVAELAGLAVTPRAGGLVRIDDPRWGGYLANVPPREWEESFAPRVPEWLLGRNFLERYSGTTDPVTRVLPDVGYAVRVPAAHAVHESARIRAFAELLRSAAPGEALPRLGELMYASHASYGACSLGEAATDRLVALVKEAGPARGLHGARITGGGSGGTVAVLGASTGEGAIAEIDARFASETGHTPHVISGSSPGAAAFGTFAVRCS
jgi:galactokinase